MTEGRLSARRIRDSWSRKSPTPSGCPLLPDLPLTGTVKHVLFAQYVTLNQATGTASFIDVLDDINVLTFPIEVRLFVVVMLQGARGDFAFSVAMSGSDEPTVIESDPFHIPPQQGGRTNIVVPAPLFRLAKPRTLIFTLLADRVPFHQEPFEVRQATRNPLESTIEGVQVTLRT